MDYMEFRWSLLGVHKESTRSTWSLHGVHKDLWGSVKYRILPPFKLSNYASQYHQGDGLLGNLEG